MKRAKRFLSMLLALCMLLGLLPSTVYAANSTHPFTDVNETDWFSNAVQYVYQNGLMNGTGTTIFSPNDPITRGQIVTILHRLDGTPASTGTSFTDVPNGEYYANAVAWSSANSIMGGYGNGLFGPADPITREQLAATMYRYAQYKGYDTTITGNIATFSDGGTVSSYAVDAVNWATGVGLLTGMGNNIFSPTGGSTRAQAATILMRFCENIASSNKDTTPSEDTNPSEDTTPTVEYHTVTFEYNYDNKGTYDTVTVEYGKTIASPTNPTRSGYSFSGWYTAASGGNKFDFSTAVTSDLTLFAHWTVKSSVSGGGYIPPSTTYYTVTFYMNDGTKAVHTTATVAAWDSVSAPAQPTRSGYSFDGWYTDAATTTAYRFGSAVTANLDLYAKWSSGGGDDTDDPSTPEYQTPEDYFADNSSSGIIESILATESPDVLTELEAKELLEDRGLQNVDENGNLIYPITYDYNMSGSYVGDTDISGSPTEKHPTYQSFYKSSVGEMWAIYIINGEVFANPLSFNFGTTGLDAEVLVIEESSSGRLTSYAGETNSFYVTIPKRTAIFTKTVDEITADSLDGITINTLCELTGATQLAFPENDTNETAVAFSLDALEATTPVSTSVRAADDNDPIIVVSLGDSFSSGEGIPPFYGQSSDLRTKIRNQDWLAHRSTKSWPSLIEIPNVTGTMAAYKTNYGVTSTTPVQWYFGASSGATTTDFFYSQPKPVYKLVESTFWTNRYVTVDPPDEIPRQLDIFNNINADSIDYVTLTIGGNDVQFADVIFVVAKNCSYLYVGSTSELDDLLNGLWNNLDTTTMPNIKGVYQAIERHAPNAAIIVAGYPKLLNKDGKGALINKQEAKKVNEKVSAFNDKIEELVTNLRNSGMNIHFVDVEYEFDGHEAYSSNAWLNPIIIGTKSEDLDDTDMKSAYSMHPNEEGAKAYARRVNAKIRSLEDGNKTLSGVITIADTDTDMTNNLPLEGAKITLTKNIFSIYSATSGRDGKYTIGNLSSGTYGIMVSKDGYIPVLGTVTIADNVENTYNAAVEAIPLELFGGEGVASGMVYDVLTGRGVSGLTLNIRKGINVTDGDIVATVQTNSDGSYTTPTLEAGNYSVQVVDERALDNEDARYLTSVFIIKILGNHSIPNQDGYVTNGLQANQLRIVLKWGQSPRDLDSHLVGPTTSGGRFHTYYSSKNYYESSILMANLDLDDTTSYGPETTTIYEMTPGVYTFLVHDFTNRSRTTSTALGNSGAYVEVYLGTSTMPAQTFYVPVGDGTLWTVFSYNSNTGMITPINTLSYHSNAGSVGSNYPVSDLMLTSVDDWMDFDGWSDSDESPLKDYELEDLWDSESGGSNDFEATDIGNSEEPVSSEDSNEATGGSNGMEGTDLPAEDNMPEDSAALTSSSFENAITDDTATE